MIVLAREETITSRRVAMEYFVLASVRPQPFDPSHVILSFEDVFVGRRLFFGMNRDQSRRVFELYGGTANSRHHARIYY